ARRTHSTIAANKGRDFAPASFPGAANGLFYDLTSVGKAGATHDSLGAHFNRFGDRRLIDERHRTGTGKKRSTRYVDRSNRKNTTGAGSDRRRRPAVRGDWLRRLLAYQAPPSEVRLNATIDDRKIIGRRVYDSESVGDRTRVDHAPSTICSTL